MAVSEYIEPVNLIPREHGIQPKSTEIQSKLITDWATIVSLVPLEIKEHKPGLNPGFFHIPACLNMDAPVIHHITNAYHSIYMGEMHGQEYISVNNPSASVAKAIVRDYVNSQLAVTADAYPGLFWLPGKLTLAEIKLKHAEELQNAKKIQFNWFERVMVITKDQWTKYHRHEAISNWEREIARILKLNVSENPWMTQISAANSTICPACDEPNRPGRVVCKGCKCILDQKRYDELKFAQ